MKLILTNMASKTAKCRLVVKGHSITYTGGEQGHAMRCGLDHVLTLEPGEGWCVSAYVCVILFKVHEVYIYINYYNIWNSVQ